MRDRWNALTSNFLRKYSQFFSLHEFENVPQLRLVIFAVISGMFVAFNAGYVDGFGGVFSAAADSHACPAYLQSCRDFIFLRNGPGDYSFRLFYSYGVLLPLGLLTIFSCQKKWALAHLVLGYLTFLTIYFAFVCTGNISTPFLFFNLVPALVLLFSSRRTIDLRWCFLLLYFLAGIVKLDESWIAGTYFSTLLDGLRAFPRSLIPVATNLVIVFELFGIWFLIHPGKRRWIPYGFFIFFHFYSVVFVAFRYPLLTLPLLLILFHKPVEQTSARISKTAVLLTAFLVIGNIYPFLISQDHKQSSEANYFTLNMFEANRQAQSIVDVVTRSGEVLHFDEKHNNADDRNKIFRYFFKYKTYCARPDVEKVHWQLIISMNGGPFRKIVSEEDICKLEFLAFQHNSWINLDGPIVGYPDLNLYVASHEKIPMPPFQIHPEPVIKLPALDQWLLEQTQVLRTIYAGLAFFVFCIASSSVGRCWLGLRL